MILGMLIYIRNINSMSRRKVISKTMEKSEVFAHFLMDSTRNPCGIYREWFIGNEGLLYE